MLVLCYVSFVYFPYICIFLLKSCLRLTSALSFYLVLVLLVLFPALLALLMD